MAKESKAETFEKSLENLEELVRELEAGDKGLDESLALFEKGVAAAKELVALVTDMGRSAAMRAAVPLFDRVYRSADAIEGPLAFKEKRKPRWRGE